MLLEFRFERTKESQTPFRRGVSFGSTDMMKDSLPYQGQSLLVGLRRASFMLALEVLYREDLNYPFLEGRVVDSYLHKELLAKED